MLVHSWICPTIIYWQPTYDEDSRCFPTLYKYISHQAQIQGGGEIQIQIFCGLIPQIKLVNHGSTGEERTPASRVITNTATHRTPGINVTVQYTGADMIALNITKQ